MYRSIFSRLLLLVLLAASPTAWAQSRWWPTGIQIGTDIARPLYYQWYQKTGAQYECNVAIDFARVLLEGDYGWGQTTWAGRNKKTRLRSSYTSQGQYFRVGLNYNLVQDTPDKNVFFLGSRYAMSFFADELDSRISYDKKGAVPDGRLVQARQPHVQARWFEAVTGFKVKVWEWLYMECTVRYKFGLQLKNTPLHLPFDILGWGLHDETAFGVNYYLSVRIPLTRASKPSAAPAP